MKIATNSIKNDEWMDSTDYNRSFTGLVARHEKIIFSVCFFYATDDVPFEDLRQEVLMSLFKGYRSFRHESAESTWVYRVAINTCLFSLRRFSPKIRKSPLTEAIAQQFPEENGSERQEKLEWLHSLISDLHPMDKALILMWLDELSYEEIAANMGISRNTVASRLYRIKEKLSSKIMNK